MGALDSWTGRRARVRSRLAEAEGTQSWNRMGCSNFFGLVSINCKKTGCPELVKAGYPEQIREIRKRSGKQSNRFRPDSEFDIPYYRTESEFVRKCENERVKWRNRCGTERDLSRPFSTLAPAMGSRGGDPPSPAATERWLELREREVRGSPTSALPAVESRTVGADRCPSQPLPIGAVVLAIARLGAISRSR